MSRSLLRGVQTAVSMLNSRAVTSGRSRSEIRLPGSEVSPTPRARRRVLSTRLARTGRRVHRLNFTIGARLLNAVPLDCSPGILSVIRANVSRFADGVVGCTSPVGRYDLVIGVATTSVAIVSDGAYGAGSSYCATQTVANNEKLSRLEVGTGSVGKALSGSGDNGRDVSHLSVP